MAATSSLRNRLRPFVVAAAWALTSACASSLRPGPPAILDGGWEMSATVDGIDYVGLLTFTPDGLVMWDGAFGERNVCEAEPLGRGGGYLVRCPVRMEVVPNDDGELVATLYETVRRESESRRCLRREEQSARMVCVEWEVTPREEVTRREVRVTLTPTEGATIRPGGGAR